MSTSENGAAASRTSQHASQRRHGSGHRAGTRTGLSTGRTHMNTYGRTGSYSEFVYRYSRMPHAACETSPWSESLHYLREGLMKS